MLGVVARFFRPDRVPPGALGRPARTAGLTEDHRRGGGTSSPEVFGTARAAARTPRRWLRKWPRGGAFRVGVSAGPGATESHFSRPQPPESNMPSRRWGPGLHAARPAQAVAPR